MKKDKEILPLTNDAMMKMYFTREGNRDQLRQFLKASTHLTDNDLEVIEIKNPTLTKEQVMDKDFIVDINVTSKTGHMVHIEMQVQSHTNFKERVQSYNSRQYATQLKRGDDYVLLNESISVIVVDFPMFDDTDEFYEHIAFRRENGKLFTTAQQLYIIDLTKIPAELNNNLQLWGALFNAGSQEDLAMIGEKNDEMRNAAAKLAELNDDQDARELAEKRELDRRWQRHHERTLVEQGIEKGIEKGIERGIEQKAIEIAQNGIANGIGVELLSSITGLSVDEIEKLK